MRLPTTLATDSDAAAIAALTKYYGRPYLGDDAYVGALHRRLLSIREEAGLPEEISALRVFDVIAWMDGKNRDQGVRSGLGR